MVAKKKEATSAQKIVGCCCGTVLLLLGVIVMIVVLSPDTKKEKADVGADIIAAVAIVESNKPEEGLQQLEDALATMARGVLGEDDFRTIDVVKQVDGDIGIMLEFNVSDNLTMKMVRGGIENDMYSLYKMYCTEPTLSGKLGDITLMAFGTTEDDYGNQNDDVVLYKTGLPKATIDKINWDNMISGQQLSVVWKLYTMNRGFKN